MQTLNIISVSLVGDSQLLLRNINQETSTTTNTVSENISAALWEKIVITFNNNQIITWDFTSCEKICEFSNVEEAYLSAEVTKGGKLVFQNESGAIVLVDLAKRTQNGFETQTIEFEANGFITYIEDEHALIEIAEEAATVSFLHSNEKKTIMKFEQDACLPAFVTAWKGSEAICLNEGHLYCINIRTGKYEPLVEAPKEVVYRYFRLMANGDSLLASRQDDTLDLYSLVHKKLITSIVPPSKPSWVITSDPYLNCFLIQQAEAGKNTLVKVYDAHTGLSNTIQDCKQELSFLVVDERNRL